MSLDDVRKEMRAILNEKSEKDKLTVMADGMTGLMEKYDELSGKLESGEYLKAKEEPWQKAFNEVKDGLKKTQDLLSEKDKGTRTDVEREEIKGLRDQVTKLSQDLLNKEQQRQMAEFKGELLTQLEGIKGQLQNVNAGGRVVEGYKTDEFRLLGQGLEHAVKKEPIKVVIEGAERILYGAAPPAKRVEQGAGLDDLLPKDMTVEK